MRASIDVAHDLPSVVAGASGSRPDRHRRSAVARARGDAPAVSARGVGDGPAASL